ncbi:MAG: TRAP transporter small permease [Chloroflexi bacterium]|nr:TRAP transporter small permease [Chloroflexota bacterium]
MVQALERGWDRLLDVLAYVAAMWLAVMTLSVVYDVLARYFLNSPTVWAVDFSEYALVYITFLGTTWALRGHSHVRIDLLARHLGWRTRVVLNVVTTVIMAGVVAVIAWQGIGLTWEAYAQGQVVLKAWQVPRWLSFLPIPLGTTLLAIECLRQAWGGVQAVRRGEPPQDLAELQEDLF